MTNLLGGQQHRRQEYDDFARRYEQGPPWDGYDDDEVVDRYDEIAPNVPPDVYEESAYEAFQRMSPQERRQLAHYLRQQARQQQIGFPDLDQDGIDDRFEQDPRFMAQTVGRMHRQQPGMFGQLATGGRARARRPQQRRQGQRRQQQRGQAGLFDSPIAKGALAGIAAMAVKKMVSK